MTFEPHQRPFPYDKWTAGLPELTERYRKNEPFPHIALDDFLDPGVAARLAEEFPAPGSSGWIQYKHYNENKQGKSNRREFPPLLGATVDELNSPDFVAWLSRLIGQPGLLSDSDLEGGGLHQSETGGFLNVHADFTMHHHRQRWRRRCNLILYLNDGWREEWGGALELWDRRMTNCVVKVPPLLNRAVIFTTTEDSYHGFPEPLRCPPQVTRKSLALYYYTEERDGAWRARSTNYRPRPQDRWRALPIWLDKTAVALYSRLKSRFGLSDDLASRVLGLFSRRRRS